jgi:hypothetical protein
MRAIHRLQLYVQINTSYLESRKRHHKIKALFSLWTTWEFDEVRSLATGIVLAYRDPSEIASEIYQQHVCDFFHYVYAHLETDMAPFVRFLLGAVHDTHKRKMFSKSSKTWSDAPLVY